MCVESMKEGRNLEHLEVRSHSMIPSVQIMMSSIDLRIGVPYNRMLTTSNLIAKKW